MISINTNLSSLIAQNNLKQSTNKLNTAIERMSTGFKINHANDNAANFSISTNMSTKISSYNVAEDNTEMAVNLATTASDTLSLIQDRLERLRMLQEQALNGTYGEQSLKAINEECRVLVDDINRMYLTTSYNGVNLFLEETIDDEGNRQILQDAYADESTKLKELGITTSSFTVFDKNNNAVETYDTEGTDTIGDIFATLESHGFTASIKFGEISIKSNDGMYIDGDLVGLLDITTEEKSFVASTSQTSSAPIQYESVSSSTTEVEYNVTTTTSTTQTSTIMVTTTVETTQINTILVTTTAETTQTTTIYTTTTSEETRTETIYVTTTSEETRTETIYVTTTSEETRTETIGNTATSDELTYSTVYVSSVTVAESQTTDKLTYNTTITSTTTVVTTHQSSAALTYETTNTTTTTNTITATTATTMGTLGYSSGGTIGGVSFTSSTKVGDLITSLNNAGITASFSNGTISIEGSVAKESMRVSKVSSFSSGKTYLISSTDDLVALQNLVNAGKSSSGAIFELTCDLNMSGVEFSGIGESSTNAFKGTFDGNGHVISNLSIEKTTAYSALFGVAINANIKNIGVDKE